LPSAPLAFRELLGCAHGSGGTGTQRDLWLASAPSHPRPSAGR
jgi:hypothetical protein